jgi:hypothetical protein
MKKKKIERTTDGLTDLLFDEMENLINGESTPQMARAKAHVAKTILSVKKLEIDVAQLNNDYPPKSIKLAT